MIVHLWFPSEYHEIFDVDMLLPINIPHFSFHGEWICTYCHAHFRLKYLLSPWYEYTQRALTQIHMYKREEFFTLLQSEKHCCRTLQEQGIVAV